MSLRGRIVLENIAILLVPFACFFDDDFISLHTDLRKITRIFPVTEKTDINLLFAFFFPSTHSGSCLACCFIARNIQSGSAPRLFVDVHQIVHANADRFPCGMFSN